MVGALAPVMKMVKDGGPVRGCVPHSGDRREQQWSQAGGLSQTPSVPLAFKKDLKFLFRKENTSFKVLPIVFSCGFPKARFAGTTHRVIEGQPYDST